MSNEKWNWKRMVALILVAISTTVWSIAPQVCAQTYDAATEARPAESGPAEAGSGGGEEDEGEIEIDPEAMLSSSIAAESLETSRVAAIWDRIWSFLRFLG